MLARVNTLTTPHGGNLRTRAGTPSGLGPGPPVGPPESRRVREARRRARSLPREAGGCAAWRISLAVMMMMMMMISVSLRETILT